MKSHDVFRSRASFCVFASGSNLDSTPSVGTSARWSRDFGCLRRHLILAFQRCENIPYALLIAHWENSLMYTIVLRLARYYMLVLLAC